MTQEILTVSDTEQLVVEAGGREVVEVRSTEMLVETAAGTELLQVAAPAEQLREVAYVQEVLDTGARSEVVEVGVQGPPGPPGPRGPAGDGDKHYVHTQGVPAAAWTIVHGLGKYPAVTLEDSTGEEVEGAISYDGPNQLTVTFSAAFSGRAILN